MRTVRIFISSPGDVAEERENAKKVIASLQRHYTEDVALVPVIWQDMPLEPTMSFQEGIDLILTGPEKIEIAVFILWSRMGTPLGPPLRPDGKAYRSGTEREFELMTEARRQSDDERPKILVYTRRDNESWNSTLDAKKPDHVLKALIEQRELVSGFIKETFKDAEGRNVGAYHSYEEPVTFAERLEIHLRRLLDNILLGEISSVTWTESPYRSLSTFDIQHASIFKGREEESFEVRRKLRVQAAAGCAFVCIVGASGSGKSSLARAGVAATLVQRSFDKKIKEWKAVIFIPSLSSGQLYRVITDKLSEAIPQLAALVGGKERFADRLETNPEAAADLLDTAFELARQDCGGAVQLLLVLDQMEELWTDRRITPELREEFLKAIELLAKSSHVSVLATLRADFYPQAQASPTFLGMKGEHGHFDLRPPGVTALRELIVHPALLAGLAFEKNRQTGKTLDQTILEDASSASSALPLLQYALSELYERRDDDKRLLTYAAYTDMKGTSDNGVEGALIQRASEIIEDLPDDAKGSLNEILPLLVSVDVDREHQAVRRRTEKSLLTSTPARKQLTDRLTAARFLTTDVHDGVAIVSLAHEALLRRWDRIVDWIDANRDLLRMRSQVEQSQRRWEQATNDNSLLLTDGLPLTEGRQLLVDAPHLLEEKTKVYIGKSISCYFAGILVSGTNLSERSADIEGSHPEEWATVIQNSFDSDSANVRKNVALLLATRQSNEFQNQLCSLLLDDPAESVRQAAAQALITLGDVSSYETIRDFDNPSKGERLSKAAHRSLARLKACSDVQIYRPKFAKWFEQQPFKSRTKVRLHSHLLRLLGSPAIILFVVVPATLFAIAGAASVKWLPSAFNYSCVQGTGQFAMGLFHSGPAGMFVGGGVALGVTLYRIVFGREHDRVTRWRPYPAILFGALFGFVAGIACVLMISLVYQPEALEQMGWISAGEQSGESSRPPLGEMFYTLFFENRCGLAFPLTSMGLGIAFALATNKLRASNDWPEFLDKQEAISSAAQIGRLIKGLVRVTLPFAGPIFVVVTMFGIVAFFTLESAASPVRWQPETIREIFLGGLDDSVSGRTNWKQSSAGHALGLFGDCLAKVVGGYFCLVGMGVGIVALRHGIRIAPQKV